MRPPVYRHASRTKTTSADSVASGSGAVATASVDQAPVFGGHRQTVEDASRVAQIAHVREAAKPAIVEEIRAQLLDAARRGDLKPSDPIAALDAERIGEVSIDAATPHVASPQVVTDEFKRQLVAKIAITLAKVRWDWRRRSLPVDAPAPARGRAENAGALRLRALVRQQSRRGPPESGDDEDPPAEQPRRSPDIGCRSPTAVCWRSADRAAWRRP
jgi:hypothetical protein